MPPFSNLILAAQAKFNRSTADSWELYASHRTEIARLLEPGGLIEPGRLCVLGAGNCNDLHLASLAEIFDAVHLVDIDAPALDAAVKRQGVAHRKNVKRHGGIDLTGLSTTLSPWKQSAPDSGEIAEAVRKARSVALPDIAGGRPFDTVLSPCVLSQICGYVGDVLGRKHPRYPELLLAIRDRHLRLLVDLTRPGGQGLLVCDMLSSDSFGAISDTRRDDLPALMDRLVYRGDFFPGLAPSATESVLRQDPLIAPLLSDVKMLRPWVWQLAPTRAFLVYAIRFRRRSGAVILDQM